MEIKQLDKCIKGCWCEYCKKLIRKNENYWEINKSAWRGNARINICILCLVKIYKLINKKELKSIKLKITENKI